MRCANCGFDNPEEMKFCGECGAALQQRCPQCGFASPPGFRFCGVCGTSLSGQLRASQATPPDEQPHPQATQPTSLALASTPGSPPAAERRQLTVLFCDLVDSTALATQLDPEELREVVRAYQRVCAEAIQRFEGHIAQYLGDGLLVYFGYPQAHEDDGQRAVRAALGMVQAMARLNERLGSEWGMRLAVRVGIHTGMVVVGEMGGGGRQEQLALGETPNVAARLQALAAPDTIMISGATQRLVQGVFAYEDLGAQTLRGVSTPVRVFHVLQEREAKNGVDPAVGGGLTPLLGRDQELGMLLERWSQVKDGHGQVVLLNGEAGIGKSRLVEAVKERVTGELYTRIELRCSPYYQQSALHPMIEVLHRQLRWRQEDSAPEKLRKLETVLRRYGFSPPDVVPLFAALLALPLPDHYAPLALAPQGQKQKTLETLLVWLLRETEQYPVLFIVEDLHWLDPSTLEFLSLVVDQTATMRLFALFTYRPIFHPPWALQAHLTHLNLSRLPRHQAALMIDQVAGGRALPAEVHQQLLTKTDGVPLFVEELTKMVLESGLLREVGGRYELIGPLPPLAIPATLQDSLMARLDRLATGKLVAQLGATIGRQFDYALLQAVSPMDEATLQQALGQLLEAELLYQSELPPGGTYTFRHALIQETAYLSLLRSMRQQYHQQIAMALVARFPASVETQPELVAHHYSEAGLAAQAVPYWQRAGQRAIERSANLEAISHLSRGLEVLKTLPDTPQRTQQELTLQLALGTPLVMIKGYEAPEVEQVYTRAQALCQQVGDKSQRFSVLVGLRRVYFGRGQHQAAREVAEECLALAQDLRNPAFLQEAHAILGTTLLYQGELLSACTHLEQGLAVRPPQTGRSLAFSDSTDPEVFCLTQLSWALWMLGYPEQALTRSRQACTSAQQLSHPYSMTYALVFASALSMFRREAQRVQEQAEAAIALAREQGFARWLAVGMGWRGWAMAELGAAQEGLAQLLQAPAVGLSQQPLRLAEVYGKAGQPEAGLRVLTETLATISRNGERRFEAELYRLQGELLLRQSTETDAARTAEVEAEACFRRALEVARRQQAKSFELRAAMSLSRLWQRQSQRNAARDLLATVYGWFTEGFDTPDLQEAKALLEALP